MFIITLGDVFGILFIIACVVFSIVCFFADKVHQNSAFKKPEDKPAPKVEHKAVPKKEEPVVVDKKLNFIVWVIIALFAVAIGCAIFAIKK